MKKEIDILHHVPSVEAFEEEYVHHHRPVIMKGVASQLLPRAHALLSSSTSSSSSVDALRELIGGAGKTRPKSRRQKKGGLGSVMNAGPSSLYVLIHSLSPTYVSLQM